MRWEGFGLTPLEAMASGTAVVSTRTGAAAQLVVDGETGALIPPGDLDGLVRAMEPLLADPEKARAMGRKGREKAVADHDITGEAARIVEVYERVLGVSLAVGAGSIRVVVLVFGGRAVDAGDQGRRGLEGEDAAGVDLRLDAGARIAADALALGADAEGAERAQLHRLLAQQGRDDLFERHFKDVAGLGARQRWGRRCRRRQAIPPLSWSCFRTAPARERRLDASLPERATCWKRWFYIDAGP